jgi:hypothetical protein
VLADDDLSPAALRAAEIRALLPRIALWQAFLGSFYGAASVVATAAGARELVQGRDWGAGR